MILSTLKSNIAGSDNINMQMLKLCLNVIDVINLCLEQEYFRHSWREAAVIPTSYNKQYDIYLINIVYLQYTLPCHKIMDSIKIPIK